MIFFRRSLLSQFSALTDKTTAQRFLDEHTALYEDGRRYQRDTEAELNRVVGKRERMGAVHLAHNDANREKALLCSDLHVVAKSGRVWAQQVATKTRFALRHILVANGITGGISVWCEIYKEYV